MRYVLVALVIMAGCDNPAAPTPPPIHFEGVTVLEPPAEWAEWYAELRYCIPIIADYADVEWRTATSITREGVAYEGALELPFTITLTDAGAADEAIVKHLMVHQLIRREEEIHSSGVFEKCAGAAPGEVGQVFP